MDIWIIVLGLVAIIIFCYAVIAISSTIKQRAFNRALNVIARERELPKLEKRLEEDQAAVHQLAREKSIGFPWLAEAYADYFHLRSEQLAYHLENKKHPAKKSADVVREEATKRRHAEKLWRVLEYQIGYYEKLFPWLSEFRSEEVDELLIRLTSDSEKEAEPGNENDPAKQYLTPEEYRSLTTTEKFQRALDRYWSKKKTRWEIGRDYERYIGYLYEQEGYQVKYTGIVEGFSDLGRDLIATGSQNTLVVQCKCWSQHKTIHEKHVFQLFGTTIEYIIAKKRCALPKQYQLFPDVLDKAKVKPVFVTSTTLSNKARKFAAILGVQVVEGKLIEPYPCVKCNVSRMNGEKIYHLPFDQQYDTTQVESEKKETYVCTISEAESLGFRRANRWRGPS